MTEHPLIITLAQAGNNLRQPFIAHKGVLGNHKEYKMEYHEVNIPIPNNPPIKGLDIPIDNSSEKFNEYTLNDGTILRVKLVISGVIRAKDQWDTEEHPIYTILSHNVVRVLQSHPSLRQRR